MTCPHCHVAHGPAIPCCQDKNRWTDEERDERRRRARLAHPDAQWSPSSEQLAACFGARNQVRS